MALSVFEVCFVDLDALFKRAALIPCPFPGVPLLASPDLRFHTLEGFRRMLFQPCVDRDADCFCVLDFVVVVVVVVNFFSLGGVSTPPRSVFCRLYQHSILSNFLQFLFYFPTVFFGHHGCDLLRDELFD